MNEQDNCPQGRGKPLPDEGGGTRSRAAPSPAQIPLPMAGSEAPPRPASPAARPGAEFRPIHISGFARRQNDFYSTPAWVTECLLRHVALRGPVWEPCCGDGAIARIVGDRGHHVVATDLAEYGFGRSGVDFFACREMPEGCRALVTNPPYGNGATQPATGGASAAMLRFLRHALDLTERAEGQLALLVRFQWIAGKKASTLISSGPFDSVIALTRRIRWFDMGEATNAGQHHHAWIVFDYRRDAAAPPAILFAQ